MAERVFFRVHGTVQGVSFRYFTQKKATELNIIGWVRNTLDNKVEGEAQGEAAALQKFLKAVNRGPTHAYVAKFEKNEIDLVDGEQGFEIWKTC